MTSNIGALKFLLSENLNQTKSEYVMKLYLDNTFVSILVSISNNEPKSTQYYGTWVVMEDQPNTVDTLINMTPSNFDKEPHDYGIVVTRKVFIEGGLKKPKFANGCFGEGKKLKYQHRDSKSKSPQPSLKFVIDTVSEAPKRPISLVLSGASSLLQKYEDVDMSDESTYDSNRTLTRAITSKTLAQKTSGHNKEMYQFVFAKDKYVWTSEHSSTTQIPELKQALVYLGKLIILTKNGDVYFGTSKLPIEEPISSITTKAHEKNYLLQNTNRNHQYKIMMISRSGKLYKFNLNSNHFHEWNDHYHHGDPYNINAKDELVLIKDMPLNEHAIKISCGDDHYLLLSTNSMGKSVVRYSKNNDDDENFIRIPSNHFDNYEIIDVACGNSFSYFLTSNGYLYAQGENNRGQCAVRGTSFVDNPTKVMDNVIQVQCRGSRTIILCKDNKVFVSGAVYDSCYCSFHQLCIPDYFKIALVHLPKNCFMFTTTLNEILILPDKGNKEQSAETFVHTHHLSENQTLITKHPCLEALVSQYGRYPQKQLKICCQCDAAVAYFSEPDFPVENFFSHLWGNRGWMSDLRVEFNQ
ncbi:gtf2b [Acrasis kona]|uniref:Gtf2b n=1 Tax=Acrasis kona TaxID=1008807 RepID=A0AAW2YUW9_9EUKA